MKEFFIKYWLEALFGVVVAGIGGAITRVTLKLRKQKITQDALIDGVRALLHNQIYQGHAHYMGQGWIAPADLKNMEYNYKAYHTLGGNGTGTQLYEEMQELPKFPPKQKGE